VGYVSDTLPVGFQSVFLDLSAYSLITGSSSCL
jgi:hypothetical protein